jgi:hypothetical protein
MTYAKYSKNNMPNLNSLSNKQLFIRRFYYQKSQYTLFLDLTHNFQHKVSNKNSYQIFAQAGKLYMALERVEKEMEKRGILFIPWCQIL